MFYEQGDTIFLKGGTMDQNLTNLRQRATQAATKFIRAQHIYLMAADPTDRKSEMELKKAAEEYAEAIATYDAALQELRQYLLQAAPSDAVATEHDRTERLIEALDKEKEVRSKLIAHHVELITQDVKLTGHRTEEEGE